MVIWITLAGVAFFAFQLPSIILGESPEIIDDIILTPRFTTTPTPPEMALTQQAFALLFYTSTNSPLPTRTEIALLVPDTGATGTPSSTSTPTATMTASPTRTLMPLFRTQTRISRNASPTPVWTASLTPSPIPTRTVTNSPEPTLTSTPIPAPSDTEPPPSDTPEPPPTDTPPPTNTPEPPPTDPPDTDTPEPPPDPPGPPGGNTSTANSQATLRFLQQFALLYLLGVASLRVVSRSQ